MLHRRGRWTTLVATDGFTVGVLEVGRREKRNCGKDYARSVVGALSFPAFGRWTDCQMQQC